MAILRNPDPSIQETDAGFFKVTVCSTRDTDGIAGQDFSLVQPEASNFLSSKCVSSTQLPGGRANPEKMDAGGPGDYVVVVVDFNHPVIVPIISSFWPKLHLSSKRQGIVEHFRTARVVGLPPTLAPPTNTSQPTDTPTTDVHARPKRRHRPKRRP